MDDNFNEFIEQLGRMTDSLRQRVDEEQDLVRSGKLAREKAEKDAVEAAKKLRERQEKTINAITGPLGNLATSFSRGEGAFDSLASATKMVSTGLGDLAALIPIFGGALKGIINATGETAAFMIQMYEKMYGDYEKLSKVGMVTTVTDFTNSAAKASLTLSMTSQILGKFSKELAYTGSMLTNASYSFDELTDGSVEIRKQFQRLGIGAVEFNEIQIGYIDRLARTGQLEGKSRADLIKGTKEYTLEIDKIAKLTGLNREEIQKERDARLRDARFRAGVATLDEKAQKSINGFLDQLKGLGPEMTETTQGLQDLIASGGVPTTEAGRQAMLALQQGGVDVQSFVEGMRNGSITQAQAFDAMTKAAKAAEPQFRDLAQIVGTETDVTKQYVALSTLANAGLKSRQELEAEAKKRQEEALKGTDEQNKNLADTRQNLINTQSKLEGLALSSTKVTSAMERLSSGIDAVVNKISSLFGGEPIGRPSGLGPATARPSTPGSPIIPGREGARPTTEEDLKKRGFPIKEGSTQKAGESVDQRLIELAEQVKNAVPGFSHFTAFNDGIDRDTPAHKNGLAFDFVLDKSIKGDPKKGQEIENQIKSFFPGAYALDEYNKPSSKATGPHFHVSIPKMAEGGLVNTPTFAQIGEAGPEAVVPLSGGRSIPVSFDGEMSKKLDALISLAERQNGMLSNVFDRLT